MFYASLPSDIVDFNYKTEKIDRISGRYKIPALLKEKLAFERKISSLKVIVNKNE
jgi:hypothetical protein